jgi:hypothetical protein
MYFTKDIKKANTTIAILLLLIVLSIIFYLKIAGVFDDKGHPFTEAMPPKEAYDNIDDYRDSWTLRPKTHVIWYKVTDLKYYIDSIYPDLKNTLPDSPRGYEWGVGFYPMRRPYPNTNSESRFDFLVVPTLFNSSTNDLLDFRNPKYSSYYTRSAPTGRTPYQDRIGYDAGHLYP